MTPSQEDHRQGQPLARRHPRRGRHLRRPHQDLPGLPLQADRPAPRQATRPGRRRQLHPHHRLAPALRPRRPLHRPRPRLARPPRPATPQTPAHRRTRTPIRQESHPPRHRLTHPPPNHRTPPEPGSARAPPGAAACPLTDRFSLQHRSAGNHLSLWPGGAKGIRNPPSACHAEGSSGGIVLDRITGGQRNICVWVRRAVSAVAWSRCHLVCHWLSECPKGQSFTVEPGW
jgi:hypothetical protein